MVHDPAATFSATVDGTTVVVRGDVDLAVVGELGQVFGEVNGRDVTVDLSGVQFMDATGLRCLLAAACDARRRGVTLRCVNPRTQVIRLFQITGTLSALGLASSSPFTITPDSIPGPSSSSTLSNLER